jgi:phosphatidate cytidylyltransferase
MTFKKVLPRLAIFFIGVPAILALIILLPWRNHLALSVVITIFSGIGAAELYPMLAYSMLGRTGFPAGGASPRGMIFAGILGAVPPLFLCLRTSFGFPLGLADGVIFGALAVLINTVFTPLERISGAKNRASTLFSCLIYPGVPLSCVIALGEINNSTFFLIFFAAAALGTDSFSWFFGMLFGKNNRGIIRISPMKSVAGYAGGILTASALGLGAAAIWIRGNYGTLFYGGGRVVKAGVLGGSLGNGPGAVYVVFTVIAFCTAVAASVGDLAESALKRSADVKDSGSILPGRGGMLDSLDSLAFAAPVFYFLVKFLL